MTEWYNPGNSLYIFYFSDTQTFRSSIGSFQTLFRESVKFWNFDKMFGASDSQQKTSGGFLIQQNPICNSRDIGDFLFLEHFRT